MKAQVDEWWSKNFWPQQSPPPQAPAASHQSASRVQTVFVEPGRIVPEVGGAAYTNRLEAFEVLEEGTVEQDGREVITFAMQTRSKEKKGDYSGIKKPEHRNAERERLRDLEKLRERAAQEAKYPKAKTSAEKTPSPPESMEIDDEPPQQRPQQQPQR